MTLDFFQIYMTAYDINLTKTAFDFWQISFFYYAGTSVPISSILVSKTYKATFKTINIWKRYKNYNYHVP